MTDVRRHRQFVEWMEAVVDPYSVEFLGDDGWAIRQDIEKLIGILEASDGPLAMPWGSELSYSRFDISR